MKQSELDFLTRPKIALHLMAYQLFCICLYIGSYDFKAHPLGGSGGMLSLKNLISAGFSVEAGNRQ